uniref:Uncharacterized protein n=1 Tax=Panagrolaimus sp. ES5 TaxID=591445 RepID=A0AC34GIX7_9BILA
MRFAIIILIVVLVAVAFFA